MPRKIWLIAISVVMAAAVLAAAPARAEEGGQEPVTVAILDFANGVVPDDLRDKNVGQICANTLAEHLQRKKNFQVAERAQIQKVTNEIRLGASGMVDPEKAAEIGKLLAVKYLVYGEVQSVDIGQGTASAIAGALGGFLKKAVKGTSCRVHVNYKVTDVETGKVFLTRTYKESLDVAHAAEGPDARIKLLNETLAKTAVKMAKAMLPKVEGIVAAVNENDCTVIVTIGEQQGVSVGGMFRVIRKGNEVKNPVTGEVIDVEITEVAKAKCVAVREKASTFQVGDNVKAKRGNKVEWQAQKEKLAEVKVGDVVESLEAE